MQQKTIKKDVQFSGKGLHSGMEITMSLHPASVNTGIVFLRNDIASRPQIAGTIKNLQHRMRCTALIANNSEVHTTEHFLATCFAMNITNLVVEINGPEIPGMDGSALPFYVAMKEAGTELQKEEAKIKTLSKEIALNEGKATVKAAPYSNGLRLEYRLDYDVSYLQPQDIAWDITEDIFAKEIAPARTFVLKQEVEALLKMGLGKGANVHNTLILDEKGKLIDNTLRFPDEFARHKMLDLLGDIALLGQRIQARITAYRSGHTLNGLLVKHLDAL